MTVFSNYPLTHIDGKRVSEMVIRINLLRHSLKEIKEEIGRKANANRGFLFIRKGNNARAFRVGPFAWKQTLQRKRKHFENGDYRLFWGSP